MVICIGRSAGESSSMVSGTSLAIVGCDDGAEHVLHAYRHGRVVSFVVDLHGPARRRRQRGRHERRRVVSVDPTTASSSAPSPRRLRQGRRGRWPAAGTGPASRPSSRSTSCRRRPASRRRDELRQTPVADATAARLASSSRHPTGSPAPVRRGRPPWPRPLRPDGTARRATSNRAVLSRAATRSSRCLSHVRTCWRSMSSPSEAINSAASMPAPMRTRALLRLPSRSAATMNCSLANGSVAATHAPLPVRIWNCPGCRRRTATRSGKARRKRRAGVFRSDVREVDVRVAAAGDVGRTIADATDVAPVGSIVVVVPTDNAHSKAEVGRATRRLGRAARRVRRGSRRSRRRGRGRRRRAAITIRARRGMQRVAPASLDRSTSVDRLASSAPRRWSSSSACCSALAGGGSMNRRSLDRSSPRRQFQRDTGEVDLGDLGLEVGATGGVLELAPQPIGDAGFGAPGPPRTLIGRRSAGADRREARHARAEIVSRHASQPGVDHDPHAADGQRRLGDVGAQHHSSPPGRRWHQRHVLLGKRQRAGEQANVDIGPDPIGQELLDAANLADARAGTPARRRSRPSRLAARPRRWPVRRACPSSSAAIEGRRETFGRRSRSSARRPSPPSTAVSLATSGVADIASTRRSGRTVSRASRANARPMSVGTLRSWTSSKITRPTPGSSGSCCSRRVSTPFGDDLDPRVAADATLVASLVADEAADLGSEATPPSAVRRLAVASRRGSSITMRPSSHGCSISHSGATVVLPAPGGATSSAEPWCSSASPNSARTSTTGRSRAAAGSTTSQPSAGVPWNGPGSPATGMVGLIHAVAVAICSATSRHCAASHPSAQACSVPSRRMNTKAGS